MLPEVQVVLGAWAGPAGGSGDVRTLPDLEMGRLRCASERPDASSQPSVGCTQTRREHGDSALPASPLGPADSLPPESEQTERRTPCPPHSHWRVLGGLRPTVPCCSEGEAPERRPGAHRHSQATSRQAAVGLLGARLQLHGLLLPVPGV